MLTLRQSSTVSFLSKYHLPICSSSIPCRNHLRFHALSQHVSHTMKQREAGILACFPFSVAHLSPLIRARARMARKHSVADPQVHLQYGQGGLL
jgi:hypothetical protein